MYKRSVHIGVILCALGITQPGFAGYYSSIDTRLELSWSRDFEKIFGPILDDLRAIPVPKPERDPVIRKRYVLMETLARDGAFKLDTLEQKLNFSAILIRRGRADEAVQLLLPLVDQHPKNFLVLSHCATAHFLGASDFKPKAPYYLKQALKHWPMTMQELKDDDRKFLRAFGWDEKDFEDYRLYETYLERLILHRLDEENKQRRKEPVEIAVDPIFTPPKEKPLRFLNERGEFEPGRIVPAEKDKLPRNAVEVVEQLVMWMPHDDRLFWLLGETFSASAMQETDEKTKNQLIFSAYLVFQQLEKKSFSAKVYGKQEIELRRTKLAEYVKGMPEPNLLNPEDFLKKVEQKDAGLTNEQWWRALGVGFITGLAVGIFALWQVQEMRRRRQARAAG